MWWVIYSLALTANKIFSRSRGALGYDRLCSAVCQILDPPTSAHQSQPPNTQREREILTMIKSLNQNTVIIAPPNVLPPESVFLLYLISSSLKHM